MANLRLCKESELRRGPIIGSGAFGTVYKVSNLSVDFIASIEVAECTGWPKGATKAVLTILDFSSN